MATITREQMEKIITEVKTAHSHYEVRTALFHHVKRSDIVPDNFINVMLKISKKCYSSVSHKVDDNGNVIKYHNCGYDGIMAEIADRITLKIDNGDTITVNDFFKASAMETDIYDSFRKKGYEKKTGAGTWLYGEGSFADIVKAYRRKRKLLMWDYHHIPVEGRKNDYPVNISICTTYKLFFDYLSTYPQGVETFFKRKKGRSEKAGVEMYDLQTVWNSKTKIAFLERFDEWLMNK